MNNKLKDKVIWLLGNKMTHIVAFFLYYVFMVIEYGNFVCRYFDHMHFYWRASWGTVCVGVVLLAILFLCVFKVRHSSEFAYALSVFIAVLFCIPAIVFFQYGRGSVFPCVYSLLFVFLISSGLFKIPHFSSPVVPQRFQLPTLAVIAGVMIIPFIVAFGFDLDFSVFSMGQEVYDARAQASTHNTIFTSYCFGPLFKVLLPLLIVYGLYERKWIVVVSAVAAMVYIFLVNPHKTVFLSIFFVFVFCLFNDYKLKAGMIMLGTVGMVTLCMLFTLLTGDILPESVFVRRMFFVPAQLSSVYFSYFENDYVYLSHSIFKHFVEYPYDLDPPHLIGSYLYGRTNVSCNTGFIGDGYMNFGHCGALVFTFGVAAVFRFLESLRIRPIFFGVVLLTLFTFLNSAFLTSLLTHGVFFFLLIAMFYLKTDNEF